MRNPLFATLLSAMVPFSGALAEEGCVNNALCESNKNVQPTTTVPYDGPLVCVLVIGQEGQVANLHFVKERGDEPYQDYSKVVDEDGVATFRVGRHWIEKALAGEHLIYGCDKSGKNGERFEAKDLEEHLANGAKCISVPLCILEGGKGCPPGR